MASDLSLLEALKELKPLLRKNGLPVSQQSLYHRGNMPSIYIKEHDGMTISALDSQDALMMGSEDGSNIMDVLFLSHVMNAVDHALFPVDTEERGGEDRG